MKYTKEKDTIRFDRPLRKYQNGVKILFYRDPHTERDRVDYPVAYADSKKGQREMTLPDEVVELLEVLVMRPKYKLFPFIWHKWVVAENSTPNN